jgi:hypothetical protein
MEKNGKERGMEEREKRKKWKVGGLIWSGGNEGCE